MLLLDEITVDLDVLARADLLDFLKEESEQRGTGIIYVGVSLHRLFPGALMHNRILFAVTHSYDCSHDLCNA